MKKIKILTPIFTLATAASVVTPLVTLTGCSKSNKSNLMKEYTPTIKQLDRKSFASPIACVDKYLEIIASNPKIFAQDFQYTLSRGLPQYISYVSEYCEIKDHNFGMDIDLDSVKVDKTLKTVTFDVTFYILFDYTGTKVEEMQHYDLSSFRWDSTTKVRFVLDFNTVGFDTISPINGQRRQMTTLAGATEFGISEKNSTVQLLSEKGSRLDLQRKKSTFETTTPEAKGHHFMIPNEQYWESIEQEETYVTNYSEMYSLWYDHPGIQLVILLFKYYMPHNEYSCAYVPNVFDFGAYHMANATLDKTFSYSDYEDDTYALNGFNSSLDSINNLKNLENESATIWKPDSGEITLPASFKVDGSVKSVSKITANSFDSKASDYTNFGFPSVVKSVVIPNSYKLIEDMAISNNQYIETLTFKHSGVSYPTTTGKTFYKLNNLKTIDFSIFSADPTSLKNKFSLNAFSQVHLGNPEPEDGIEGTIILPDGWKAKISDWYEVITQMGLPIYEKDINTGWKLTPEN